MRHNGLMPQLSLREWRAVLRHTVSEFLADDCMGLAKQVAYSSLLAFFPAIVALVGLLAVVNAYDALQRFLSPVAPRAVTQLIRTFAQDTGGPGSVVALLVGALGATWAASGAMGSVVKAVNRAWDRPETRPFWKLRLISIALVLVSALAVVGMLVLIVLGGTVGAAVAHTAHLGSVFTVFWNVVRWPIALAVVLGLFALIYNVAPNHGRRAWRWVTPGTVLGALMWVALSGLFSLYTAFSNSYTKTYGTLAGGIVLLLWLNYSAWAILLGAELDAELEERSTPPHEP